MDYDDDDIVTLDFASGPSEPLAEVRVTSSGRSYRVPDPQKKVIYLGKDCGQILFDAEFFRHLTMGGQPFLDEGNPIINAEWKNKNLLPFRRPWRPDYSLRK